MDPARLQDLVQRHLDGLLTDAERRELDAELQASADARKALLEATRLDAALHIHFHREPSAAAWTARLTRAARPIRTGWRARWRGAWTAIGDHVWGPAGAVLVHAVLLVILFRWVFVPSGRNEEPVMQVTLSNSPEMHLDALPEPSRAPAVMEPALPEPEFMPRERLAMIEGGQDGSAAALLDAYPQGLGYAIEPSPLFAGRAIARQREASRRTPDAARTASDAAFQRGVERLCALQSSSGAWDEPGRSDVETTSLALLAVMSRGQSLERDIALDAIRNGARFLVGRQDADGRILDQRRSDAHHATAVCALGEAYLLTRIGALKPALEAAVRALTEQASDPAAERDPAWCLWAIQAVRIALSAKCEVADLGALRAGFEQRLARQRNPTGEWLYYPADDGDDRAAATARTAASVVAWQWLGHGRAPAVLRGLRALERQLPRGRRGSPGENLEGFLAAQAMFNAGPATWQAWQPNMVDDLLARQTPDGGWTAGTSANATPRETALRLLMLATPFRYPPPA